MVRILYLRTEASPDYIAPLRDILKKHREVPYLSTDLEAYTMSAAGRKYGWKLRNNVKRRFFVLSANSIAYYADQASADKKKSPKGVIGLDFWTSCDKTAKDEPLEIDTTCWIKMVNGEHDPGSVGFDHGIRVRVPHISRTYYIFLDTQEERDKWFVGVNYNIARIRQRTPGWEFKVLKDLEPVQDQFPSDVITKMKFKLRYKTCLDPAARSTSIDHRLLVACRSGDFSTMRQLLIDNPTVDCNATFDITSGSTLLFELAAQEGATDILRWFLDCYSVDVNKAHQLTGDTPVMAASILVNVNVLCVLLEYGADRNIGNKFSELPITACGSNSDIREVLTGYYPPLKLTGTSSVHSAHFCAPQETPVCVDALGNRLRSSFVALQKAAEKKRMEEAQEVPNAYPEAKESDTSDGD